MSCKDRLGVYKEGVNKNVCRYAVEFETDAKGNMIKIPEEYQNLSNKRLHVFIIPINKKTEKFDPLDYYGIGTLTKEEIDAYLNKERDSWESISYDFGT